MTVIEVGGLGLIIVAGLGQGTGRQPSSGSLAVAGERLDQDCRNGAHRVAFIGFEHLVNVAEELKEPSRTLPRALFLTLGITALFYAVVVWVSVTAVPPQELARSASPLALVFERLTGMPLVTMSAIAIVATLNGVIVHMIMIARVIYGLADQGSLPKVLARLNPVTRTPILATIIGMVAILGLALSVPLAGLADWTARFTLLIFAIVNVALIRIKRRREAPPAGAFICPPWCRLQARFPVSCFSF
jgi:amino acid transporter